MFNRLLTWGQHFRGKVSLEMWGVPLKLQLLGLTTATLLLLATTWVNWEPGTALSQSPQTIVVSHPLDALPSEAFNSPEKPRHKIDETVHWEEDIRDGKGSSKGNGTQPRRFRLDEVVSLEERANLWRQQRRRKLLSAKRKIAKANNVVVDPSFVPEVYHNLTAFLKSYEEMEKTFRIYVYKDGRGPFVHDGPMTGIYASEGQFIAHMQKRGNRFVVRDPWRAQMFFMPYSVKFMEAYLYVPESQSLRPITSFVNKYVETIKTRHPFWNITNGTDHFFVSCHDWGPKSALDHIELRSNAVKVVCNADTSLEEYSPQRDISLPEINIHYLVKPSHIGGPGPENRLTLAFFAGQMHGPARPKLVEYWQHDPDMRIYSVQANEMKKPDYIEYMRSSKYCICAQGFEVNSPRIVESIYQDCVPVIIADHIVLPFSDVLDWDKFSITILESEIPNLKAILTSIPDEQYRAMQQRLQFIRPHFLWNDSVDVKYDVFHMILHSLWLRTLQQVDDLTVIQ